MRECYQFQAQSVLEHGWSVHRWFLDLHAYLQEGVALSERWRIPSWLKDDTRTFLASRLLPLDVLRTYHIYHDCGKPLCRVVDGEGKQHFLGHAQVSYERWLNAGGDAQVADLILHDMDIHQLKADGIAAFASSPNAVSLLCTGLAEVHSNAQMFGGIESDSFKMKFKHLDRRGKALIGRLMESPHP